MTEVEVVCIICGKKAKVTGEIDGSYEPSNLTEVDMSLVYGKVMCNEHTREYKGQFVPIKLKSRIDHIQAYTHQVIIPANENLLTIDVTDKVIASGIPPADIMVIGTPDYPVALGIKGRMDAGRYYLDIGIIPKHVSDVVVTILAFALSR